MAGDSSKTSAQIQPWLCVISTVKAWGASGLLRLEFPLFLDKVVWARCAAGWLWQGSVQSGCSWGWGCGHPRKLMVLGFLGSRLLPLFLTPLNCSWEKTGGP